MSTETNPAPAPAAPLAINPQPAPPYQPPQQGNDVAAILMRQQEELSRMRRASESAAVNTALASGIAQSGVAFVPGGASQFERLVRGDIRVQYGEDGTPTAVAPDGRPVAEYVRGLLQSGEYAHFRAASNPNGGTATNPFFPSPVNPSTQTQPIPPAPQAAAPPRNLGEFLLAQAKASMATAAADPRGHAAVGLRPIAPIPNR